MGLALPHGGHLTHGMKINVSGRLYDIAPYEVERETDSRIDMDEVERIAKERRPKLILAGWSAYPRLLDFERFRAIADEVGALLMVDMAHFAGLVAAGLHPNPVPYADVVTTTIHKTLGGARGGMILCREEHAKKINSAVFPGQQGGPLDARHRRQGGRAEDRRDRGVPRAPAAHGRRRARRSPSSSSAPATASTSSPAAPTCTSCSSTCASPSSTASRPRTACTTSASPSTATRCRSTRARRWSRQRPARRHVGARHPRRPGRGLPRDRRDHRRRAGTGFDAQQERAGRARDRDRRPLPALRAPGCAGRTRVVACPPARSGAGPRRRSSRCSARSPPPRRRRPRRPTPRSAARTPSTPERPGAGRAHEPACASRPRLRVRLGHAELRLRDGASSTPDDPPAGFACDDGGYDVLCARPGRASTAGADAHDPPAVPEDTAAELHARGHRRCGPSGGRARRRRCRAPARRCGSCRRRRVSGWPPRCGAASCRASPARSAAARPSRCSPTRPRARGSGRRSRGARKAGTYTVRVRPKPAYRRRWRRRSGVYVTVSVTLRARSGEQLALGHLVRLR